MPKKLVKYPIEEKLEKLIENSGKGIRRFFRYITKKPKNQAEVMDKHALIFEILAIVFMFVAVFIRAGR